MDDEDSGHARVMARIKRRAAIIGAAALAGIAVTAGLYVQQFPGDFVGQHDIWGQFGDFFGGTLNPILAFLSFSALLYTIVLQMDELHLSRTELKRSANALTAQSEFIQRQNYEATFFQLVRLHHEIVGAMEYNKDHLGRAALEIFKRVVVDKLGGLATTNSIDAIAKHYETEFRRKYDRHLMHYFRNIAVLLHHVSEAGEPGRYAAIARAQLSIDEQVLLFYEAAINRRGELRRLVQSHGILFGVDYHALPHGVFIAAQYQSSAFERPSAEPAE